MFNYNYLYDVKQAFSLIPQVKKKSLNITTKKSHLFYVDVLYKKQIFFFFYRIDFLILPSPKQELFVKYLRNSSCFMIAY